MYFFVNLLRQVWNNHISVSVLLLLLNILIFNIFYKSIQNWTIILLSLKRWTANTNEQINEHIIIKKDFFGVVCRMQLFPSCSQPNQSGCRRCRVSFSLDPASNAARRCIGKQFSLEEKPLENPARLKSDACATSWTQCSHIQSQSKTRNRTQPKSRNVARNTKSRNAKSEDEDLARRRGHREKWTSRNYGK